MVWGSGASISHDGRQARWQFFIAILSIRQIFLSAVWP